MVKKLVFENGNYLSKEKIELWGFNNILKCHYEQINTKLSQAAAEKKELYLLLSQEMKRDIYSQIDKIDFKETTVADDYLEGGSAGRLIVSYEDKTTLIREFDAYIPDDIINLHKLIVNSLDINKAFDVKWILTELMIFYVLAMSKENETLTFANCCEVLQTEMEMSEKDDTLFNKFPKEHPVTELYNIFNGIDKLTYQEIIKEITLKIKNYDKVYGGTRLMTLSSESEVHDFAYEIIYFDKGRVDMYDKPNDNIEKKFSQDELREFFYHIMTKQELERINNLNLNEIISQLQSSTYQIKYIENVGYVLIGNGYLILDDGTESTQYFAKIYVSDKDAKKEIINQVRSLIRKDKKGYDVINIYLKNIDIDVKEVEEFYLQYGLNVKLQINRDDYIIININEKTSVMFNKCDWDKKSKDSMFDNYKDELRGGIYYDLLNMDTSFCAYITQNIESMLLIYIFALFLGTKTDIILFNKKFIYKEEISSKLNNIIYGKYTDDYGNNDKINGYCNDELEKDENKDIYEFIGEKFHFSVNAVKKMYKRIVYNIEGMENWVYIKITENGESAILNTITRDYLFSEGPISAEHFIKYYNEGKTNERINYTEHRSKVDGIDYSLAENILYEEDGENLISHIKEEKTLDYVATHYNWDDGLQIPELISEHECCTLGVALKLFDLAGGFEYIDEDDLYSDENISIYDRDIHEFIVKIYNNLKSCKYQIGDLIQNVSIQMDKESNRRYYKFDYTNIYNKLKSGKYEKYVKKENFIFKDTYSNLENIARYAFKSEQNII